RNAPGRWRGREQCSTAGLVGVFLAHGYSSLCSGLRVGGATRRAAFAAWNSARRLARARAASLRACEQRHVKTREQRISAA
ncbi:MAG: hypothetical protein AAGC70_20125, partial [Pseudomonadota bacterium]